MVYHVWIHWQERDSILLHCASDSLPRIQESRRKWLLSTIPRQTKRKQRLWWPALLGQFRLLYIPVWSEERHKFGQLQLGLNHLIYLQKAVLSRDYTLVKLFGHWRNKHFNPLVVWNELVRFAGRQLTGLYKFDCFSIISTSIWAWLLCALLPPDSKANGSINSFPAQKMPSTSENGVSETAESKNRRELSKKGDK